MGFKVLHVYLWVLSHVQLFAAPWTVHGIFQTRILEWGAIYHSRGSFPPKCSMTYSSSPLQSYPLLSAPTHYTYTFSFSLFPSRLLLHQELYTAFSLAWNILPGISLFVFIQVKTQMLIPQWRPPCSLQLPTTLLYFPHRTYCYPPPTPQIILLVCLLTYCLSLPLEYKQ